MPSEEKAASAPPSAEEADAIEEGRQWFLVFMGLVLLDQAAVAAGPILQRQWSAAVWGTLQLLSMAAGAYFLYVGRSGLRDAFATLLAMFGFVRLAFVAFLALQPLMAAGQGKLSEVQLLAGGAIVPIATGLGYFAAAAMLAFHPAVQKFLRSKPEKR